MEIDTSSPDGNIFTTLGIATNLMRRADRTLSDIDALRRAVMNAPNYKAACAAITEATFGSIVFVNSNEDD